MNTHRRESAAFARREQGFNEQLASTRHQLALCEQQLRAADAQAREVEGDLAGATADLERAQRRVQDTEQKQAELWATRASLQEQVHSYSFSIEQLKVSQMEVESLQAMYADIDPAAPVEESPGSRSADGEQLDIQPEEVVQGAAADITAETASIHLHARLQSLEGQLADANVQLDALREKVTELEQAAAARSSQADSNRSHRRR